MKKFNLQESSRESRGALHLCVLRCTSVRCAAHVLCVPGPATLVRAPAVFSFLYFLKIKISKIYVCFEIFQFFFKFATKSLE